MSQKDDSTEVRDMLLLAGGVACLAFGAGLLFSHAKVRQLLMAAAPSVGSGNGHANGQASAVSTLGSVIPDVARYIRLRDM